MQGIALKIMPETSILAEKVIFMKLEQNQDNSDFDYKQLDFLWSVGIYSL
jgi:hypothetical protein